MDEIELKQYFEKLKEEHRKAILKKQGAEWKEELPIVDAINRAVAESNLAEHAEQISEEAASSPIESIQSQPQEEDAQTEQELPEFEQEEPESIGWQERPEPEPARPPEPQKPAEPAKVQGNNQPEPMPKPDLNPAPAEPPQEKGRDVANPAPQPQEEMDPLPEASTTQPETSGEGVEVSVSVEPTEYPAQSPQMATNEDRRQNVAMPEVLGQFNRPQRKQQQQPTPEKTKEEKEASERIRVAVDTQSGVDLANFMGGFSSPGKPEEKQAPEPPPAQPEPTPPPAPQPTVQASQPQLPPLPFLSIPTGNRADFMPEIRIEQPTQSTPNNPESLRNADVARLLDTIADQTEDTSFLVGSALERIANALINLQMQLNTIQQILDRSIGS